MSQLWYIIFCHNYIEQMARKDTICRQTRFTSQKSNICTTIRRVNEVILSNSKEPIQLLW